MSEKTTPETGLYKKGDLVASMKAAGIEVSKTVIKMDELMPLLTREDLGKIRDWIAREALMDPETDPEWRRELLSEFETCPCCNRWLGHNNPPADDDNDLLYRRQPSFDFDR